VNLLGFLAALALAAQAPFQLGPGDPRIRLVAYAPDQVVSLPVADGYAAVVALGPDERVESVVVGDSAMWQVTASKRGDHVVVKPLGRAAPTNMVVITGERRYVFLLEPGDAAGWAPFVLRFTYPGAEAVAPASAVATPVATYRVRGSRPLFPAAMSDDGRRTTIGWSKDVALPAVFAVEKGGRERLVNGRMVDGDYVIEGVAERFVFRLGKARATARRLPTGSTR
jgi:type IV secretion system protein VirB9